MRKKKHTLSAAERHYDIVCFFVILVDEKQKIFKLINVSNNYLCLIRRFWVPDNHIAKRKVWNVVIFEALC